MAYYSVSTGFFESVRIKKRLILIAGLAVAGLVVSTFGVNAGAAKGLDQYGYNDKANVFVGPADGVDRNLDSAVWGDPEYASDHLVMKWNKAWEDCNAAGYDDAAVCAGAWTTNHWNGMSPSGTQTTYGYKIIWVGSEGEESPYWKEGGYSIWGNYEVIAEQGTADGEHYMMKAAAPGLGQKEL